MSAATCLRLAGRTLRRARPGRSLRRFATADDAAAAAAAPSHYRLQMPDVGDEARPNGTVVRWKHAVGDRLEPGDAVCDFEVGDWELTCALDESDSPGYLARVFVPAGVPVPSETDIAIVCDAAEDVAYFAHAPPCAAAAAAVAAATAAPAAGGEGGGPCKDLMRTLRGLMQSGALDDEQSEALLGRAMHDDAALRRCFEGACPGDAYDEGEFDEEFFLIMVRKLLKDADADAEQDGGSTSSRSGSGGNNE